MAQPKLHQKRRAKAPDKTWQQTKSATTRNLILDAALDCFYDLGYARTTTEQVARRAGVSRGAMLHHFPSRFELIQATVEHLSTQRLATFERAEMRIQRNVEHTNVGDGIDAYWRQLNSRPFVVFHELQVAARTDPDLRKVLLPAIREFDARWVQISSQVFPDLSHSRNFRLGNLITTFLLEGMAVNQFTRRPGNWVNIVLDDLKVRLGELFEDVVGVKPRSTEPRQIIPDKAIGASNPQAPSRRTANGGAVTTGPAAARPAAARPAAARPATARPATARPAAASAATTRALSGTRSATLSPKSNARTRAARDTNGKEST